MIGRNTQGVRLVNLVTEGGDADAVSAVTRVVNEDVEGGSGNGGAIVPDTGAELQDAGTEPEGSESEEPGQDPVS